MNRFFLSFFAACRTRSSALGASTRLSVRDAFCWLGFPLARPLPSIPSAAGVLVLFGDFLGTMGLSDFPRSFVIGFCPQTSLHGPRRLLSRSGEHGTSQVPHKMCPYVPGS